MSRYTEHYLVIGGVGFLGSYIVQALVDRGEHSVAVYDLKEPFEEDKIPGVLYFCGNICDSDTLLGALRKVSIPVDSIDLLTLIYDKSQALQSSSIPLRQYTGAVT